VPDPTNPQSLNRYFYVEGNPLRYWDPTGHSKFEDWLTGVGIKIGNSGAMGKALMVSGATVVNHLNDQRQDIFFPDENTTALDRLGACAEIGGGSVVFAAAVTEVFAGTLTTSAISGGTAEVATTAGAVATAASADGDPTNEVRAIQTGINTVYRNVQEGATRYIGITNDFARRAGEHLGERGLQMEPIPGLDQLSRFDARAVEQVLIEHYELPNLVNRINSIATTNPMYQEAIQRGTQILNQIGFFAY
jgi:hypothetical protein